MKSISILSFFVFVFAILPSESLSAMASLTGARQPRACENSAEIEDLARFAVQQHNDKQNALLEFARVLKAEEQVVAGTMHHLTVEAIEAGKRKIYEATIWVKPWLNFKELQEFKYTGDAAPSFTSSDLGVKKEGHGEGWQAVPVHDPAVRDAANHAITTLQQRSNSLIPYVLDEILHAKAEVADELAKFEMVLKVKRGTKEEKYKAEVHKNNEGLYHLNQLVNDST